MALIIPLLFSLIVSGAYPDPVLNENGGEAILLQNAADEPLSLAGWTVQTKSRTYALPARTIGPNSWFLIGGMNWSERKDKPEWPNADLEVSLSLANTDGFVNTLSPTGEIVDSLAWNSTAKPKEGQLWTQEGAISPQFYNSLAVQVEVPSTLVVTDAPPVIHEIVLPDDSPEEGIQLMSYTRTIPVRARVTESNGDAITVSAVFLGEELLLTQENQSEWYSGEFSSDNLAPGTYSLTIKARDSESESTKTVQVTILRTSSVRATPVEFRGMPGQVVTVNMNITNEGNSARTIRIDKLPFGALCTPLTVSLAADETVSVPCTLVIPLREVGTTSGVFRLVAQ